MTGNWKAMLKSAVYDADQVSLILVFDEAYSATAL